ncbi:MAG TPA: F0F1 ATP synthase subunit A [Planctomycetota bacterium]|nr:F0F1 ATP synthase subunit A [Planctomycetota bacterium]
MTGISLEDPVLVQLGPIPIKGSLATSVGITVVLSAASWFATRRLRLVPGKWQTLLELFVTTLDDQIRQITAQESSRFVPLLGTLFLFIATANLSLLVPGVHPPTEHLETPLALALLVFFSVHVLGVQARGLGGYLRHYLSPNPILAPLHAISEVTRTFSLTVRLFGNMMSHGLVLAVVAMLAGLFAPIPIIALGLLVGLIQAYIFTILATTYVAAAITAHDNDRKGAA